MKMVKSLLLGGAAGLVAVAGAQAADLPVKAKPVEYVKICSLYGEGFFYIPGTDTCLKIGGWVRYQAVFNQTSSDNPLSNSLNTRSQSPDFATRARTVATFDARSQTEWGTLRAYYRGGFELTTGSSQAYGNGTYYTERAFIQLGGWTLGRTQSFFDIFANVWSLGAAGYAAAGSNTAPFGTNLASYTAQFGNGVSATLSIEDSNLRRNAVWDATANTTTNAAGVAAFSAGDPLSIGAYPGPTGPATTGFSTCGSTLVASNGVIDANATSTNNLALVGCGWGDYAQQQVPDIVGNLRVDQAWGSAQISGALHQVRANFYGNNFSAASPGYTGISPSDAWGFAVNGGIMFNLPWNPGDKFWVEGTYDQGSSSYTGFGYMDGFNSTMTRFSGGAVAAGWGLDAVFACNGAGVAGAASGFLSNANSTATGTTAANCNRTGLQLSTSWQVTAAAEHYWTPALRSSVWGSWASWSPGGGNATMCSSPLSPIRTAGGASPNGITPLAGCDFSFQTWEVGTRTIWNPVKNLDVGFEVAYQQIVQHQDPGLTTLNFGGSGTRASGNYTPANEGNWVGLVHIQRNFYP